jgi:hypothetical protein
MASRDERIANLAATLKGSGVAKSDAQSRMMAEEMIGVEENVQKRFDEEHAKAQEFLRTSKNLGTAGTLRQQPKQELPKNMPPKQDGVLVRPIERPEVKEEFNPNKQPGTKPVDEAVHEKQILLEAVHTDTNFGNKSLKDLMFDQIKEDGHEIKNIEELKPESPSDSVDMIGVVNANISPEAIPAVEPKLDSERVAEEPKLDSEKLVALMEEDGKLEEHTREIKEKPKNVKPKEEYAENNIDLSSMFNVHK